MFPFCVALDEDPLEVLNPLFLQAICIALLRSLYASGPLYTEGSNMKLEKTRGKLYPMRPGSCMESFRLCSVARVLGWTIPLKRMTECHELQVARIPLTWLYTAIPVG